MSDGFRPAPLAGAVRNLVRQPNYDEEVAIQYVLDAALEWHEGRLPYLEAVKIGAIAAPKSRNGVVVESTAYARWLAIFLTPRTDPRWFALYELTGKIERESGAIKTKHGTFDARDVARSGDGVRFRNLRVVQ